MKLWRGLSLVVSLLLLSGCSLLRPEAQAPDISVLAPVVTQREVLTVGLGTVETWLNLVGSFGGEQQTALYFRSGGRVREVRVRIGDRVSAGDLLLAQESGSLAMDVEVAAISLELTQNTYNRWLSRIGFVDEPSATDLRKYELDVRSAELKLERLQEQLRDTRIFAPHDGVVLSLSVAAGDQADAYRPVLTIASTQNMVMRVTVDEVTAAQLRPGQKALIYPNDGDATGIPGVVVSVPAIGTATTNQALIAPDQPSSRMVAGRNGRVEVLLGVAQDVVRVPTSAVRTFGGRRYVTVVEGEVRQEVAITVGLESDQWVEVVSGLSVGDRVLGR